MNSNFNSDLGLEPCDDIEVRLLKNEDIPALIQLGGESFFYLNQACSLMVSHLDDTICFISGNDYEKIFSQQMAFGAFKEGKLVSFAVGCDYAIDVSNKNLIPTPGAKICLKRQLCFPLNTENSRTKQVNAFSSICLPQTGLVSKKMWQRNAFMNPARQPNNAWHPATKKITEKMFKEVKIETSITEYKGQQTNLWAISATF